MGKLKLGKPNDKPEFNTISWFAMLFSAGMGIGLVFYGAAFNKIISSLVENIIMPLIGKIFGSVDFAKEWSFWGIKYGLFIQSVIDFIIIAFALFIFVKIANTLMKKEEAEEEAVVEENVVLLTEIRDLLREKK
ncbi:mechanosensitive ion channel protein MscL [Staphylococcus aureus]|nr:mechanosensitive ion channel protein MscL [Staphylococcus aureus]